MSSIGRVRAVLAERDFLVLLAGQCIAQAADGMAQAVFADELILDPLLADTPERILAVFALTLVPYSVIGPFLGVFVDRWARRALMVWTNAIRALLLVTVPLWSDRLPSDVGLFAAVIALLGFGRLFLTTKGASLPAVLHERFLLRGNAISGGAGMIAALVGGVIGLGLVAGVGSNPSFVFAGLAYAAAALVLGRLSVPLGHAARVPERFGRAVARIALDLGAGLRAVWTNLRARLPIIGVFIVRSVGMLVTIAAILVIKDLYADDADARRWAAAAALGAAGAGAFLGATLAPLLGRRLAKAGLILLGFAISGIGIVALGGIEALPALFVLTFIGGLGTFTAKVAVDAQVQEALPDDFRGRAFAVYDILYNLASVVAAGVMVSAETTALRPLLISAGAISLLVAGLLGIAMHRAGMLALKDDALRA